MRGFTLIELVMVIAIMGVLGVAAVVSMQSPSSAQLGAASTQVQSDIEFAKQNAVMTGQTSGVNFTANGTYTVYQGTTATPLKSPMSQQDMITTLSTNYPNVTISTNYVVEFNAFGAPTTGGGGNVKITNGSATKTISVTANTGLVTVQ